MDLIYKICFWSLTVIYPFFYAYTEYAEWMEQKNQKKWDRTEHISIIFQESSAMLLGITFVLGDVGYQSILFALSLMWAGKDGLMNLMKKRNFFAVSNQSGNPFERWNIVKIILIVIGIILILWKG
jgi:hypothetical protein